MLSQTTLARAGGGLLRSAPASTKGGERASWRRAWDSHSFCAPADLRGWGEQEQSGAGVGSAVRPDPCSTSPSFARINELEEDGTGRRGVKVRNIVARRRILLEQDPGRKSVKIIYPHVHTAGCEGTNPSTLEWTSGKEPGLTKLVSPNCLRQS